MLLLLISIIEKSNARSKAMGSKFYTIDTPKQVKQETHTGSDYVKRRATAIDKHRSLRRTAVALSFNFEKGFESNISSDKHDCLYFGGDTMPNGNIILCDWLNFSVKMFEPSGQFICKTKLIEAPLDVTAILNDIIVISFGSRSRTVMFFAYVESNKVLNLLGCNNLPGFLYNTTKFEGNCLGIFEMDSSKKVSVVHISVDKTVGKLGASRRRVTYFIYPDKKNALTSESGIFYDLNNSRLYVTSRHRRLIFRKGFVRTSPEMYILGSVTCDEKGVVYIASDQSILQVTKDGDLTSVVLTPAEPYHIILTKDQRKLAIVGKQNEVLYYKTEKSTD